MIPLPCTGLWTISSRQNNPNLLFIFIVGYTYAARFSFVKPFQYLLTMGLSLYRFGERRIPTVDKLLLCLRHFLGSLCPEKNAPTCLSLFVNLTMKIMQWETSATEKLKTLFLMLVNSSSLFQLKCILMCNIRKEHSPMLKEIFRPALQCLGNLQTSNSRFQGL